MPVWFYDAGTSCTGTVYVLIHHLGTPRVQVLSLCFVLRQNDPFIEVMKRHDCSISHGVISSRHSQRHLVGQLQLQICITDGRTDKLTTDRMVWHHTRIRNISRSRWYVLDDDKARCLRLCSWMCTWQQVEVGYSDVQEEMLHGNCTLCPVLQSIQMTSLLEDLAENGGASMPASEAALQTIVGTFRAKQERSCNLYTLVSFGQSAS